MFVLEFEDSAKILRTSIEILKERIPEATLVVRSDGIFLQSMDTSLVALVDLVIYPAAASVFDCDDKSHELGIQMDALAKIFSCHSSRGNCRITHNEEEAPDVLDIEFNTSGEVATYQLKLINGTHEEHMMSENNIPKQQQTINATRFQHKLKDLANFDDVITISRKDRDLIVRAAGENVNASFAIEVTESIEEEDDENDNEEGSTRDSTFAIAYLQWFAKARSLAEDVLVAVGAPLPLLMQYAEDDVFKLQFYLAPKIEG